MYRKNTDYSFWFALIFISCVMVAFNTFVLSPMGYNMVPRILALILG